MILLGFATPLQKRFLTIDMVLRGANGIMRIFVRHIPIGQLCAKPDDF